MPTSSIRLVGATVLRQVARVIEPHERPSVQPLIDCMRRRISESKFDRGIAAPQLGESVRAFVVRARPEDTPVAMVNPRVVRSTGELVVEWETCMSVPHYAALVEVGRAKSHIPCSIGMFGSMLHLPHPMLMPTCCTNATLCALAAPPFCGCRV